MSYTPEEDNPITRRLIEEVKNRPLLWDPAYLQPIDRNRIDEMWNEISLAVWPRSIRTPENEKRDWVHFAKLKWSYLKEKYVKALQVTHNATLPPECEHLKEFPYFNELSFLFSTLTPEDYRNVMPYWTYTRHNHNRNIAHVNGADISVFELSETYFDTMHKYKNAFRLNEGETEEDLLMSMVPFIKNQRDISSTLRRKFNEYNRMNPSTGSFEISKTGGQNIRRDSAPINQGGPSHINQAGRSHLGQAGPSHIGQAGPSHIGQAGPSHMGQAGPSHIDQAGKSHINQAGPSQINQAGPSHIGQAGPSHIDQAGPSHIDQAGPSHIDQADPNYKPSPDPIIQRRSRKRKRPTKIDPTSAMDCEVVPSNSPECEPDDSIDE